MDRTVTVDPGSILPTALEELSHCRSVTGLSESQHQRLKDSALSSYLEMYRNTLVDHPIKDGFDAAKLYELLIEMAEFESVGDFLYDAEEQRNDLCGFGLLIHAEIIQAAYDDTDGWELFQLYDQLVECCESVRFPPPDVEALRLDARRKNAAAGALAMLAKSLSKRKKLP